MFGVGVRQLTGSYHPFVRLNWVGAKATPARDTKANPWAIRWGIGVVFRVVIRVVIRVAIEVARGVIDKVGTGIAVVVIHAEAW